MTITVCEPGVWTDIPDTGGAMLLEARGTGFYVDTGGGKPTNPAAAYALASNEAMVIAAGVAVAVQPAQSAISVIAVSNLA